jgi:hypothetical protein
MEFTTTKEREMLYTIRINYTDETFAVSTFPAESISDAIRIATEPEGVRSATCLGTIDRRPQEFLAW